MAAERSAGNQLEQWISLGATIAAPVTVLGALLFYFGYVSSASEYAYFGINVDTIGLSTQDYVIRSPQTLLVPLLVLTLVSAGLLMLNGLVHRRITAAQGTDRIWCLARRSRIPGLVLLAAGVVLLFIYSYVRNWALYGLVTPFLIAFGSAIVAYSARVMSLLQRRQTQQRERPAGRAAPADASSLAHRTAGVVICLVIAASIFWATATVAQWSGRGLAEYAAAHFGNLPSVILDTRERLYLRDPGVKETQLPPSEGQTFHYRYRGLRLLIEGQNRMFLVPGSWSASDSTLIVPLDGSVRVQFQFQG